jgi:hypothetical protein
MQAYPQGAAAHTNVPMEARGLYIIREVLNAGYSGDPRRQRDKISSIREAANAELTGRRDRVIAIFSSDFQTFSVDPHIDVAVSGSAGYGLRAIS